MLSGFDHSYALATLLALLPAVTSWLSGRSLIHRADDPVLAERLFAHQRRSGIVLAFASAASAVFEPRALLWTIPLLFVSSIAGSYPLRRVIFAETWSFTAYLSFFLRLTFGVFGLWILLGLTPALAWMAGTLDWAAGAVLGGTLLAWNRYYSRILRALLRCRPFEESALLTRCRTLAANVSLPEPQFLRIDLRGGVVANAVALPSFDGNAVIFSETLLDRLTEDEIVAICGHELAHFEYYSPARLRRLNRLMVAIVALAAVGAPLTRLLDLDSTLALFVWLGTFSGWLVHRARDKQRQETVCDLRAVEITGNPDAFVSALTKLYVLARMPRRVATEQDRAASHPSLARRIKDIRRATGRQPAPPVETATFFSADGGSVVTFEGGALHWEQEAGVTQMIAYSHLHELRLHVTGRRGPTLRAVSSNARRWEMRISAKDVPRLQTVLDSVDGRLADAPAPRTISLPFVRILGAILVGLAASIGQVTVAIVVGLATLRAGRSLFAGAAAAALCAAALSGAAITAIPLVVSGVLLAILAVASGREKEHRSRLPVAVLSLGAALLMAWMVPAFFDLVLLHQSARNTSALPVLLVALVPALASLPHRSAKAASVVAGLLAVSLAAVSSQSFLDAFGRDPFLLDTPPLAIETIAAPPVGRFSLPELSARVQLSPSGQLIAAQQDDDDDREDGPLTFQLGRLGESLTPLTANAVRFLDDDTVLVAEDEQGGTSLRQIVLASSQTVVWRQWIPRLQGATLGVSAHGAWYLEGWDSDEAIVRAEGVVGGAEFRDRRWRTPYARDAYVNGLTTAGPSPLVVETRYDRGVLAHLPARAWALGLLLSPVAERSRYWLAGEKTREPLGESHFGAHCTSGLADGALVCTVFDGARTRLLRFDATDGSIKAIGWLEGRFFAEHSVSDGWLLGWRNSTPMALDVANRRAVQLSRSQGRPGGLAVSGEWLAALVMDGEQVGLRLYRIPSPEGRVASAFRR